LPQKLKHYLPALYNLECKILSIIPPVLPILKPPGFNPPTVAGPIIVTFFSLANNISFLVIFSGMPSAIMAIVLIYTIYIILKNENRKDRKISILILLEDNLEFRLYCHKQIVKRQSLLRHQHFDVSTWHLPFFCTLKYKKKNFD